MRFLAVSPLAAVALCLMAERPASAACPGAVVTGTTVTLNPGDSCAGGLAAGTDGIINAPSVVVPIAGGVPAIAVEAQNGGQIFFTGNSTITTSANGVLANLAGSLVDVTNGTQITVNGNGQAINMSNGGLVMIDGTTGIFVNAPTSGLGISLVNTDAPTDTFGSGIVINIATPGAPGGIGLQLDQGSSATLDGLTVQGSKILNSVAVTNGSTLTLTGATSIKTDVNNGRAMVAGTGSLIDGSSRAQIAASNVGTEGGGVVALAGGHVELANGFDVTMTTAEGSAVRADGPGSFVDATHGSTITVNATGGGTAATGVLMSSGGLVKLDNTSQITINNPGAGVQIADTVVPDGTILPGLVIVLNGQASPGFVTGGLAAVVKNGVVPSFVSVDQLTVEGNAVRGLGLFVVGSTIEASNSSITINGETGVGAAAALDGGSTIALTDTMLLANGPATAAVRVRSEFGKLTNVFTASGGSITATGAPAFAAQGGLLNATLSDGVVVDGDGELVTALARSGPFGTVSSVVDLSATTGAILNGDAFANATSTLRMSLSSGAKWTGAALDVTSVDVGAASAWVVTGDSLIRETLSNAGLIFFQAPAGDIFKTITTRDYAGNGGVMVLNTFLDTDGSPSDRLIIAGGLADPSFLRIRNAGGPGAETFADGILVVATVGGGTTTSDAFALAGPAVGGAFEYFLFRGGQTVTPENQNNWYLRSEINCEAASAPRPPCPPIVEPPTEPPPTEPPPQPPRPSLPVFRPEVPAYVANLRAATSMFVQTLHERLGEPQFADDTRPADGSGLGSFWLRSVGRRAEVDLHGSFPFDASTDTWLIQGGLEVADWSLLSGSNDRLHLGAMAGYGEANSDASALGNPRGAKSDADGTSFGAYATWYENDKNRLGLYLDAWLQYGLFSNDVKGDLLPVVSYDSNAFTTSLEAGYAFMPDPAGPIALEPQAQFIYLNYAQDDLIEPSTTHVSGGDDTWISRLGVRAHGTWISGDTMYQPYLELNWWHDFSDGTVTLNALTFGSGVPQDRGELGAGLNVALTPRTTVWAKAKYQLGDNYEGYEGLLGAKYAW